MTGFAFRVSSFGLKPLDAAFDFQFRRRCTASAASRAVFNSKLETRNPNHHNEASA
jgi:hypothetical protein